MTFNCLEDLGAALSGSRRFGQDGSANLQVNSLPKDDFESSFKATFALVDQPAIFNFASTEQYWLIGLNGTNRRNH